MLRPLMNLGILGWPKRLEYFGPNLNFVQRFEGRLNRLLPGGFIEAV